MTVSTESTDQRELLVHRKPLLLQDIRRSIDEQREAAQRALATAAAPWAVLF